MLVYQLVCLLVFCLPALLGYMLLLCHPAGTAEQYCAGLSALCSTKGVVSPVYVAIQTKGKLLMVEMQKKKKYSDLLHECLELKVVIQSSARPDAIFLHLQQ